jgi:Ser/Thr protein kinase RdoA (MazF antagonist)
MEQRIKERFTDPILHETMQQYAIESGAIRLLDGFESFIYEFDRGSDAYILRIGHSLRRNAALIHGEVEWINYLASGGASVANAILSEGNQLVESFDDHHGGQFLATAFMKAPGKPVWKSGGWTPELFVTYGRLLGRIHTLTKQYTPSNTAWKRPEWDDPINLDGDRHMPASETCVREKFHDVMAYLQELPKDDESYGLIHQDAHAGNFFVDEAGQITLFDFDDCVYSWFIYDIAMALFYTANDVDEKAAFTQNFMSHFLRGYAQENRLDPKWLKEIPYFLKFREIDLYAIIHRSFDVEHLDDPWCARYMKNRKERIEQDVPFIDFDFESLTM